MTEDLITGKCPCCNYNKLFQRWSSNSHTFQMEGCANCGFGYGTNMELPLVTIGFDSWKEYILRVFNIQLLELIKPNLLIEINLNYYHNEKDFLEHINPFSELEVRRLIFNLAEKLEREENDGNHNTLFSYSKEEIEDYKKTNPIIFKKCY